MKAIKVPLQVLKIIELVETKGYLCYLVGGSVRDLILGRNPLDYDFATNASPEVILDLFQNFKPLLVGNFGTVLINDQGFVFEITTFRKEGFYLDHRRPTEVTYGNDLKTDLARRDFTINALAYNKEVFDYYGGVNDLRLGVIKTVGEASLRFEEDALRILRALRFSVELEFLVEKQTKKAIFDNKNLLKYLSMERITSELNRILEADKPATTLIEFKEVLEPYLLNIDSISLFKLNFLPASFELRLAFLWKNNSDIMLQCKFLKLSKKQSMAIKKLNQCFNKRVVDIFEYKLIYKTLVEGNLFDLWLKSRPFSNQRQFKKYDLSKEVVFLKDLDLTGEDLLKLGYSGETIGQALNQVYELTFYHRLKNDKKSLLSYLESSFLSKNKLK